MHQEISACRLCNNTELIEVLDLGIQAVNYWFPRETTELVETAPLKLVKCMGDEDVCGLLQLAHTHVPCRRYVQTNRHCNRALGCTMESRSVRGVRTETVVEDSSGYLEPRGEPSYAAGLRTSGDDRNEVRLPLSILSRQQRPLEFLKEVRDTLDDREVCILAERYMPYMLQKNSYDSICHQELAYYALRQIRWMARKVALKIVGIALNPGGILSVVLTNQKAHYEELLALENVLDEEARSGLHTLYPYRDFAERVIAGLELLRTFLDRAREARKS